MSPSVRPEGCNTGHRRAKRCPLLGPTGLSQPWGLLPGRSDRRAARDGARRPRRARDPARARSASLARLSEAPRKCLERTTTHAGRQPAPKAPRAPPREGDPRSGVTAERRSAGKGGCRGGNRFAGFSVWIGSHSHRKTRGKREGNPNRERARLHRAEALDASPQPLGRAIPPGHGP